MTGRSGPTGGVTGTLGAFNFIRRVAFPSTPALLSAFCTLVLLPELVTLPSVGLSLALTFWLTFLIIIAPAIFGELLNSTVILRGDRVLDYRRLMGLELLSWWTLPILVPLFALAGLVTGNRTLWVDGLLLSLSISLPVRFLTFYSMSAHSAWRKALASAVVPVGTFAAYVQSNPLMMSTGESFRASSIVMISSLVLSAFGVSLIIRGVEKAGSPSIGASPMGLFRSFLVHWLKKDPAPLEEKLSNVGSEGLVETAIIGFSSGQGTNKGCIVVSNFHPGPYRDLGSGGLPSSLKSTIESEIGGIAMVPHGVSNHEYNIISRKDVAKLLREVRAMYPSKYDISTATCLIREESGQAKASAQAFGHLVFLTLTLAPHAMEDIPHYVLTSIREAASKSGFTALVVDAHNSLTGQTSITPGQAKDLTQAAIKALTSAFQLRQQPFKVGVAKDSLVEFRLEDGIGPGGLSMAVVKVDDQLVSYLTVDGNNMQTGLREVIIRALQEEGVNDGEVMTTDTHLVTGLVRSPLGYHPVGEGIDQRVLLRKVQDTLNRALDDLEDSSAGFSSFKQNLRVLGSNTFSSITSFIASIVRRIVRSFLWLEIATSAIALVFLALL